MIGSLLTVTKVSVPHLAVAYLQTFQELNLGSHLCLFISDAEREDGYT